MVRFGKQGSEECSGSSGEGQLIVVLSKNRLKLVIIALGS